MTQQQQINSLCECLEGLTDAIEQAAKSRDIIMKLLKFESERIESLEDKIDLLMRERVRYNDIEQER